MKKRNERASAHLSLIMASTGLFPGGFERVFKSERIPEELTEDEKVWLMAKDPYSQEVWRKRFKRGLSKQERDYVNAQLEEVET